MPMHHALMGITTSNLLTVEIELALNRSTNTPLFLVPENFSRYRVLVLCILKAAKS